MNIKLYNYLIYLLVLLCFLFFLPYRTNELEFPVYRVALDPGHGGISMIPRSQHGDRYSKLKKKYLSNYGEGAKYRRISEHLVAYQIAEKVSKLLKLTETGEGYKEFKSILEKYSASHAERIVIMTMLSRENSKNHAEIEKREDPNAEFRLFDYPDKNGKIRYGRISKINHFKPQLVVSLHCDVYAPRDHRGITSIIVPPYRFFKKGFDFLKDRSQSINFFRKTPYMAYWFIESTRRSSFQWFVSDASIYFTGYKLKKDYSVDHDEFLGYKQNMVTWSYADQEGWEAYAEKHPANSSYSIDAATFKGDNSYWKREMSIYEEYRRAQGIEGYGGDNFYASQEIIRFMLASLNNNKLNHSVQRPGNPYGSVWSLPLLVNAVVAYIELGYLSQPRFRYLFSKKQDELAEGIAVGIYSLFTGVKYRDKRFKYAPKGKRIDFEKYKVSDKETYFDIVTSEIEMEHSLYNSGK
jgi:N-acetylmuramoyl-L-alanine amidase